MLTRLGATATPEDAVALLLECHDRIRSFLAMAGRIAAAGPGERDGVAEAAARVARYFRQALPLHARDEEDSILPRLRGADPEVDAALADMEREHGEHEVPLAALVAACESLAAEPSRLPELAPSLSRHRRGAGRALRRAPAARGGRHLPGDAAAPVAGGRRGDRPRAPSQAGSAPSPAPLRGATEFRGQVTILPG